ncbi:hypothetical protein KC368_g70 [Hortaea werneckii]|nr:hypothetical protein KC368_g70 [Hortaea werneckii]
MRFLRAFLLTSVLRMAQVTTEDAMMRMVAASTIHPPQFICGTNRRMSTKKARRVTRNEQGGDGVNDEDRGQTVSRGRRELEMGIRIWPRERATNECALDLLTAEESAEVARTCIITQLISTTIIAFTVSKYTEVISLKGPDRDGFNNRRRERTQKQENESGQEDYGQRSRWPEERSSFGTEGLLSGLSAEVRSWRGGCTR